MLKCFCLPRPMKIKCAHADRGGGEVSSLNKTLEECKVNSMLYNRCISVNSNLIWVSLKKFPGTNTTTLG